MLELLPGWCRWLLGGPLEYSVRNSMNERQILISKSSVVIRSGLRAVYWPGLLHHTWWSVLSPGYGPRPGGSRLSSLLLTLTPS